MGVYGPQKSPLVNRNGKIIKKILKLPPLSSNIVKTPSCSKDLNDYQTTSNSPGSPMIMKNSPPFLPKKSTLSRNEASNGFPKSISNGHTPNRKTTIDSTVFGAAVSIYDEEMNRQLLK